MATEKSREMRLRHAAKRQRCTLHRNRHRDPHAWGYGRYCVMLPDGSPLGDSLFPTWWLTLDEVERWLSSGKLPGTTWPAEWPAEWPAGPEILLPEPVAS